MLLIALKHFDWQVLRVLVRAEARRETPTGRELRPYPTRGSKDGTFLDDLVATGLIEVAEKLPPALIPAPGETHEPAQFRTRYRLTDTGRHAAEYGEYEQAYTPRTDAPLVGLAAEVVGPLIEKAASWKLPQAADVDAMNVNGKPRKQARKK